MLVLSLTVTVVVALMVLVAIISAALTYLAFVGIPESIWYRLMLAIYVVTKRVTRISFLSLALLVLGDIFVRSYGITFEAAYEVGTAYYRIPGPYLQLIDGFWYSVISPDAPKLLMVITIVSGILYMLVPFFSGGEDMRMAEKFFFNL